MSDLLAEEEAGLQKSKKVILIDLQKRPESSQNQPAVILYITFKANQARRVPVRENQHLIATPSEDISLEKETLLSPFLICYPRAFSAGPSTIPSESINPEKEPEQLPSPSLIDKSTVSNFPFQELEELSSRPNPFFAHHSRAFQADPSTISSKGINPEKEPEQLPSSFQVGQLRAFLLDSFTSSNSDLQDKSTVSNSLFQELEKP